MSHSMKIKIYIVLTAIGITLFTILLITTGDPYHKYRESSDSVLAIKPLTLKYNQSTEELIRDSFGVTKDKKEKSILAGLHWLLGFINKEENFQDVFTDFVILAAELARTDVRPMQKVAAQQLLQDTLTRGAEQLPNLFPADEEGLWDFLGILQIVYASEIHRSIYISFYQKHFSNLDKKAYTSGEHPFEEAVQVHNYEVIGDYLIDTSFLHYFIQKYPDNKLHLPPDEFESYLHQFNQFEYDISLEYDSNAFSDIAYLATHVVLVLTNYGENLIYTGVNRQKVERYLNETYTIVSNQLGDIDLFAEYLQCIKILYQSNDFRIAETEQFLLSLQRKKGSWGSKQYFIQDPYTRFHPTWAVLTGLNH